MANDPAINADQELRLGERAQQLLKLIFNLDNIALVRDLLKEIPEAKEANFTIDCDAEPYAPEGSVVVYHQEDGIIKWTKSLISLYLSREQRDRKLIEGRRLREALEGAKGWRVLNANVLDFLLEHPELIPEEWKHQHVYFLGTIYHRSRLGTFVRYLHWQKGKWRWSFRSLEDSWDDEDPVAVCVDD